eukprot:4138162-Pyramimonas_sp.AAC.1
MSVFNWKDDELWAAVGSKDIMKVRKLLQQGADVNMICPDYFVREENAGKQGTGRSLLHHAAWAGDLDVFKLLVAQGADIARRRYGTWHVVGVIENAVELVWVGIRWEKFQ